jgi:hypothetical protein
VSISSCGLRDAGAPFGHLAIQLRVFPATQYLLQLRHAAWPAMAWPATNEAAAAPAALCTIEADGKPADAASWQRAWVGLHAAFRQGMERLYNEWDRAVVGGSARLEVEASPLVGQARLTWGWRRTAPSVVAMRIAGSLDLLALAIDMRLSGQLAEGSARARMAIHCKGRSELRMTVAQLGAAAAEAQDLKSAVRTWRFPLLLDIEPACRCRAGDAERRVHARSDHRRDRRRVRLARSRRWCRAPVVLRLARGAGRRRARRRRPAARQRPHREKHLPAMSLVDWSAG